MTSLPEPLLTIDCGNSTVDALVWPARQRQRWPTHGAWTEPLVAWLRDQRVAAIAAVSVVPAARAALAAAAAAARLPLRFAGDGLPCPLRLDYATPQTLGADRWVGAVAAFRRAGRAVVVDCGSATTCNLVDADGAFRGGAIAPGLPAFVAGLAAATPALPAPDLDAAVAAPARSSQAGVDLGVLLGYAGLVERLVAAMLAAAGGPAQVFVTGGNAPRLLRHSRLRASHVPDLVHEGLRALAGDVPWTC